MKLIDKAAVVAEIKRLLSAFENSDAPVDRLRASLLIGLLSFINTLEVKEVNLDFSKEVDVWVENNGDTNGFFIVPDLAKHFFELGLQAGTDKELIEEIYSHLDSIKDTADRMTSGNFMYNRVAIKISVSTIAKVLELMGLKAQKGEQL